MFSKETLLAIEAHAIAEAPRECCGLVVEVEGREVYMPCENVASHDSDFKISHEHWELAEDSGEIRAIVHSHPDESAEPTESDRVSCEKEGIPWIIVSVREGKVTEKHLLTPTGWEAPLIGRSFFHGVLDCYTLIKDCYKRELGIYLPETEREDDWWDKGQDLYVENYKRAGFRVLDESEPIKPFDVLLMQYRAKVSNHGGVYLGDVILKEMQGANKVPDSFIHHLAGRLSTREVYGGHWMKTTTHVLRHKDTEK